MPHDDRRPHYLRFARVLALVSIAGTAAGCQAVPPAFACNHCRCGPSPFAFDRPVTCSFIGRDDDCCMIIEGPLPPPNLEG